MKNEACVIPVPFRLALSWADGNCKSETLVNRCLAPYQLSVEPFAIYIMRLGDGKKGMFQMLERAGFLMQFEMTWKGIIWFAHTSLVWQWGKEFGTAAALVTEQGKVIGQRFWTMANETRFTRAAKKAYARRH